MAISLTEWLDPAIEGLAREARLPTSDISTRLGGEGIGVTFEVLSDLTTKGWLNKTIQGLTGLIAGGYAIFGQNVPPRLREELITIGAHELLRLTELRPQDIAEMRSSLDTFLSAVKVGDWDTAARAVLKSPEEIMSAFGMGGVGTTAVPQTVGGPVPSAGAPVPSAGVAPATGMIRKANHVTPPSVQSAYPKVVDSL